MPILKPLIPNKHFLQKYLQIYQIYIRIFRIINPKKSDILIFKDILCFLKIWEMLYKI